MTDSTSKSMSQKTFKVLLTVLIVLLAGAFFCLPFAIRNTWAWGTKTDHTLTYRQNDLSWNSDTEVREDGTAVLTLFSDKYGDVAESADGDNIVAPGLDGANIVRLCNDVTGQISYTAVLYKLQSDEDLPIEVSMTADGAIPTENYYLPAGVPKSAVLNAYGGTLGGKKVQEFGIDWKWELERDYGAGDELDTALGNAEVPAEVEVGLFIVVVDDNTYNPPKTGDINSAAMSIFICCLAAAVLILILIISRRGVSKNHE